MLPKVILVDINRRMVEAWRTPFAETPEVEIIQGSMLAQEVDAWVSPTNARGSMDGGLDAQIKSFFGSRIERKVQRKIDHIAGGHLPVGRAVCVPTGRVRPRYLISTPTMVGSSEDVSDTLNVLYACAAAFHAAQLQNRLSPNSIRSMALPGLGAHTGRVPVDVCAEMMWNAFDLFESNEFRSFGEMRRAIKERFEKIDFDAIPVVHRREPVTESIADEVDAPVMVSVEKHNQLNW